MKYKVRHHTTYEYSEDVATCHSTAHLFPRATATQTPGEVALDITPTPQVRSQCRDYFGNTVLHIAVQHPHRSLTVTAECVVDVCPPVDGAPHDSAVSTPWKTARDAARVCADLDRLDAFQFIFDSPLIQAAPHFAGYARESFLPGRPLREAALDLTARIRRDFKYDQNATEVNTPLQEVWNRRRGVCQDFAHLQIACLRSLGLPARYVSGYHHTRAPDGRP